MPVEVTIGVWAGAILSVIGFFIPWFKDPGRPNWLKSLGMIGLLAVATVAVGLSTCLGVWPVEGVVCNAEGYYNLFLAFIMAIVANQGIFTAGKNFRKTAHG